MSVSVNLVGMAPGAGGSFPMAGTRPKVRKTITYNTPGTYTWVAPQNVYFVNISGCAGGGSGASGATSEVATGGGGGEALVPSIIQVNPSSAYTIIVGSGGVSSSNGANGNAGGHTRFIGDITYINLCSGSGGTVGSSSPSAGRGGTSTTPVGSLGYIKIAGGNGGSGSSTGVAGSSGVSVEDVPGGNTTNALGTYVLCGGGASLYGTGSNGLVDALGQPGLGAGSGGVASTALGGVTGKSSFGGNGFFRIVWEE